jgi:hypothetical protein
MPSQLKSDTARANGAKSRGPKSAETKEKSSRNSLRHGFTARSIILLECESTDEFQKLEEEFAAMHQPATPAEQDLVDEMVAARWRIQRIRTIETVIQDCEMIRKKPEIEKTFLQPDSGVHLAMAFRTLAEESSCMALVSRYETRLSRMYDRAYRTLLQLQRQAAEPKKQKTEPEPPEPPKPNGSNQIAMVPERTQPSEPETKTDETNPSPSPTTVARALLRAVSRLFATPLSALPSRDSAASFTHPTQIGDWCAGFKASSPR